MPTYTYKCPQCGVLQDHKYRIGQQPKTLQQDCGVCGAEAQEWERVLAPNAFVLRGKGWAKDGYGS